MFALAALHGATSVCEERELGMSLVPRIPGHDAALVRTALVDAEQRGETLPPISVVQIGQGYAVVDGHHRVSVARSRGAVTIDAVVDIA